MRGIKRFKKSQILIFGSLLIFVGVCVLLSGSFKTLREEIFENVRLSFLEVEPEESLDKVDDAEEATNVEEPPPAPEPEQSEPQAAPSTNNNVNVVKYDYIGYLEIPKIRLRRGFLAKESRYNNIEYNVMVSESADFPDVENGNFILVAHSGNAYIAFFAYLYKLVEGDMAYVTYNGTRYSYRLVRIEEQEKTGTIAIHRPNYNVRGLTLITCTKDNDHTQSIYIFEMV